MSTPTIDRNMKTFTVNFGSPILIRGLADISSSLTLSSGFREHPMVHTPSNMTKNTFVKGTMADDEEPSTRARAVEATRLFKALCSDRNQVLEKQSSIKKLQEFTSSFGFHQRGDRMGIKTGAVGDNVGIGNVTEKKYRVDESSLAGKFKLKRGCTETKPKAKAKGLARKYDPEYGMSHDTPEKQENPAQCNRDSPIKCSKCKKHFKTVRGLKHHLVFYKYNNLECCNKYVQLPCPDPSLFHPSMFCPLFRCYICQTTFLTQTLLDYHVVGHLKSQKALLPSRTFISARKILEGDQAVSKKPDRAKKGTVLKPEHLVLKKLKHKEEESTTGDGSADSQNSASDPGAPRLFRPFL